MSMGGAAPAIGRAEVLDQLGEICLRQELGGLQGQLAELYALVHDDLAYLEQELADLGKGPGPVRLSADHLLQRGGKRLRPTCVALAARVGAGFDGRVGDIAVAAELVHSATLLHDDVVDQGEIRRGAAASRLIYGNAASIFAGDWLLIEALRRVRRASVDRILDRLLDVIEEMIMAESLQLQARGTLHTDHGHWQRVVEGKTASLFRWAMFAGARAGGLDDRACEALEAYGGHLGVAFQAVDDALDFSGSTEEVGKSVFADLREGKMSWPLIAGLKRDESLRALVEEYLGHPEQSHLYEPRILTQLSATGAVVDCLAFAQERANRAISCLESLPRGPAHEALVTAARAAVDRTR